MNNFECCDKITVRFEVDKKIYDDNIISKVLYWLSDDYVIFRKSVNLQTEIITLQKKLGIFSDDKIILLKNKINQDFIDYKVRDIVNIETRNIRDILYIKAFANNDDFTDYNLISE